MNEDTGLNNRILSDLDGLINSVEEELGRTSYQEPEELDETIRSQFMNDLSAPHPVVHDGYLTAEVSSDEMEAVGSFHAPTPGRSPLTPEGVREKLESIGILAGVRDNAIQEAVWRANTEMEDQHEVVVAKGMKPRERVPKHVLLRPELVRPKKWKNPAEREQVDYRLVSPFVLVKKGTLLGKIVEAKEGEPGYTVRGTELEPGTRKVHRRRPGKNVARKGAYFYAASEGRFEWGDTFFRVNPVLELTEEVAYSTGHIDFSGDVILHKGVKDRFHIHAGGSVLAHETLDASDVICGGDLAAHRGIIGRNESQVRVEGSIKTKYIENCYVESKGPIEVEVGVINSFVNTLGTLVVKGKGVIVGGKVYAQGGVAATQVGSAMSPRTEIHCGVDFGVAHKLQWIQQKSVETAYQLQRIEQLYKRTAVTDELEAQRGRLQKLQTRLRDRAEELVFHLDKEDGATICVSGAVYPGSYLEIVHAPYDVRQTLKRVCFSLDKSLGKVVTDRYRRSR